MASVLESLPRNGRVAVIRLRSLGDCVLTTPALDILKRYRPDLRLGIVVEEQFRAIFEGNPDIDEILRPDVAGLRRFRPDLCLNLHGGTRSASLTALSGARYRAGFAHFRQRFVYNVAIPRAQEILRVDRTVHTAEHLASAAFFLGAPRCEIPRAKLYAEGRRSGAYAVIHPFASAREKTWPAERFLAVAEYLVAGIVGRTPPSAPNPRSGSSGSRNRADEGVGRSPGGPPHDGELEPVFIGGAGDDLSLFSRYRTVSGAPLSEVKALLAGASLFIGNDSGPAHMAAAFGVPEVVIFGASDPAIWRPWRTPSEILTAPAGIRAIAVEQVLEALARLRVHA